ncbi:MAG: universal stress protein [Gammaproteobacteria bacterium]
MRLILVPVADRPECAVALESAFALSQSLSASIVGCHIRPHRHSSEPKPSRFSLFSDHDAEWQAAIRGKSGESARKKAERLFCKMAKQHDFRVSNRVSSGAANIASWREVVGSPDHIMGIHGPVSDMLVVSRPGTKSKLGRIFLMAAMMKSYRPVLILPPKSGRKPGKRIAIAWNQSGEASRAVAAAIPLLQQAQEVNIIALGPENSPGPKSTHLASYLARWGVKANRISGKGRDEEQEMLKLYRETKSDLLVMGAYSRSRLREQVFGGMTEHMLSNANIPVFMLHS